MKLISNKKIFFLLIFIFSIFLFSKIVFAVWDGQPYEPGAIDNPECLPSEVNCDVLPAVTAEIDPIFSASDAFTISGTNISNWNSAYNWGDHSQAGYLTSYTETDPIFTAWNKSTGISITESQITDLQDYLTSYTETDPIFSASDAFDITNIDITNWDTAYGWGDHSQAGYETSLSFGSGLTRLVNTISNDLITGTTGVQTILGSLDGNGLIINAGRATQGGANQAGGDLTLKSGISTGNGSSAMHFYTTPVAVTGYVVGDTYGGGKIAYILQPGDPGYDVGKVQGLIAATSDQTSVPYWHYQNADLIGTTSTNLGTGLANTNAIITAYGAETNAASLARAYNGGGYNDWYLPSKDEMNKLWINKDYIGGFLSYWMWTSSEQSLAHAWVQLGTTGTQTNQVKYYTTARSRPIRSFSIDVAGTGDNTPLERLTILGNGNVGIGQVTPTAYLHIKGGTATAGTAPIKLTSGTLNTAAEAGAVEFLTDAYYGTITTGASRKNFIQNNLGFTGGQTIVGGTAVTDKLVLQGTTGNGTLTSPAIQMNVGNAGATTALTVLNNGNVTIGSATTVYKLNVGGDIFANGGGVFTSASNKFTNTSYTESYFQPYIDAKIAGQRLLTLSTYSDSIGQGGTGDIVFTPLQVEKMRILANGNVGIGTTNPGAKLDIAGSVVLNAGLTNLSSRPAIDSGRISGEINGYSNSDFSGSDGFLRLSAGGTNTKSYVDISGYSQIADMNQNIIFGTQGSEKMRISNNGNVGIGVVPKTWFAGRTALQIGGTGAIFAPTATGSTTDLHFMNNAYVSASGDFKRIINNEVSEIYQLDGNIDFRNAVDNIADSNISWLTRMRVGADGNVGIGTTAPGAKLQVNQSVDGSSGIKLYGYNTASDGYADLYIETAINGKYLTINSSHGTNYRVGGTLLSQFTPGVMNIYGAANGYFPTQRLGLSQTISLGYNWTDAKFYIADYAQSTKYLTIVPASGNVGIGTTNPGTKLEIGSSDLGDGVAGPIITIGRNTNATNAGAGSINFLDKAGNSGYIWQDSAGYIRINTQAPSNANDTAGTIVGDQTSIRETKQDISDYSDYSNALLAVVNAPLHTFRYIKEVNGYGTDSPLAKTRIGFIADEVDSIFMVGNSIDQVSINGLLMASVKELNLKLESMAIPVDEEIDKSFIERFYEKLVIWLGSSDNGLEQICVKKSDGTSFCVNGDQLEQAINGMNSTPTSTSSAIPFVSEPIIVEPTLPTETQVITEPATPIIEITPTTIISDPIVSEQSTQ